MDPRLIIEDVLVVVPGILGSRLRRNGKLIWGGTGTLGSLARPQALALTGDGHHPDPGVKPDGLVTTPAQLPWLVKIDAYGELMRCLHGTYQLHDGNLVVFAYDWRLSCAANACLLRERVTEALCARRSVHPDAGLVFIAHSMGGLVVQHFTDVLGGYTATKRVISVGTPFLGAVKALGALGGGILPWLPGMRSRTRRLVQALPSVYELLPQYKSIIDGERLRRLEPADLPDDADGTLFDRAARFHADLERNRVTGYERTVIVGVSQKTPQFARIGSDEITLHSHCALADGLHGDKRGDGTVPRQSFTPTQWATDAAAHPVAQSHFALPSTPDVARIVFQVLSATLREKQAKPRAILALDVDDAAPAGQSLKVQAEVVDGDDTLPLRVRIESVQRGGISLRTIATREDGQLRARFDGLPVGDYRVVLEPASRRVRDLRPVWDLVTVFDPDTERNGV